MNKKHYIILVGLVVLFGLTSLMASQYKLGWLDSFSSNLSSGFLGSLLTAWLIERSLENQKRLEMKRINNIAFNQLRPVLLRHLGILIDWYKAAIPQKPESKPILIEEVFNDDFFTQVRFLDFSKSAQTLGQISWFKYTMTEFENMRKLISQVIDKYASFLDVNTIEYLEKLINSDLVSMLITVGHTNLQEIDRKHNYKRTYNILYVQDTKGNLSTIVEEHIKILLSFLEFYNSVAPKPIFVTDLGLWRENSTPKFGSGRLDAN